MPRFPLIAILCLAASGLAQARDVPDNVRSLYNSVRARGECSRKLATGFYSSERGTNTFSYCGDHLDDSRIVYLQGTRGALANMDVDCDGASGGPADDGRCASSRDTQSISSFRSTLNSYRRGVADLNANVHPYVVFGNDGSKPGWRTFDPRSVGIEPLSLIAVVCGDRLIYGVWGDTNGDDGPRPMVGEASISLATACYGTGIAGNTGHDDDDVLYIAFVGKDAVPGAQGANWSATDYASFDSSIQERGNTLVQRIGTNAGAGPKVVAGGHGAVLSLAFGLAVTFLL